VTLRPAERASLADARPNSAEAHDLFLRASELLFASDKDAALLTQAIGLLERSITLDPDFAEPHAGLAVAYVMDFQNGWTGVANPLARA